MQYLYCENENFEDLASGRVIYGGYGIPNFSVRLLNEIFGRCLQYTRRKDDLAVYDPCCGGGYSLTVLGFCHADRITALYGSDIDLRMVDQAKKNTALLTKEGLEKRMAQLRELYAEYHKESHREALSSAERLAEKLCKEIPSQIMQADATKPLAVRWTPDVIITDVPYGNLVSWEGGENEPLYQMLETLAGISDEGTVLAVSMDKKQSVRHAAWKRLEKQQIGKRKFEIYLKETEIVNCVDCVNVKRKI